MPGGGVTPQIVRTNSLFPSSGRSTTTSAAPTGAATATATVGPTYNGTRIRIDNPAAGRASRNVNSLVPSGFRLVANHGSYIEVERVGGQAAPAGSTTVRPGQPGFVGPTANPSATQRVTPSSRADEAQRATDRANNFGRALTSDVGTVNGVVVHDPANVSQSETQRLAAATASANSVFGPLNLNQIEVNPDAQFVMSYGATIDPTTGQHSKTGALEQRGIYGSADSMEHSTSRLTPAQQAALKPGQTQNQMTVAAGVQWFRKLSVSDPGAYNAMVVALRNAGYMGSTSDAQLPLDGWSRDAGKAFAYAATDLADAATEGEQRPLLDWLTAKGATYAASLAEAEAANAYKPVDRTYQDPELVKQTAKKAAIDALGRALTPEEEARFEASFRGKEDGFYDKVDAAGQAKTAAVVEQPNLGAQADAFVGGAQYDTERAGERLGSYAQAFEQMMGL